jgi:hypothetical protein
MSGMVIHSIRSMTAVTAPMTYCEDLDLLPVVFIMAAPLLTDATNFNFP